MSDDDIYEWGDGVGVDRPDDVGVCSRACVADISAGILGNAGGERVAWKWHGSGLMMGLRLMRTAYVSPL